MSFYFSFILKKQEFHTGSVTQGAEGVNDFLRAPPADPSHASHILGNCSHVRSISNPDEDTVGVRMF
jgi:hypothetical protein